MPSNWTRNTSTATALLLWVLVLAALAYGVVQTAVDAAALFVS